VRSIVFDPLEWSLVRSLYTSVLSSLNFSADYTAAELAPAYCTVDPKYLWSFEWGSVSIVMPPATTKPSGDGLIIAVEGYSVRLLRGWGLKPQIVVTDLDFEPEEVVNCDCLVLAHAHGDNIDRFTRYAPRIGRLIPTVQVWPRGCSVLIPGFTDGDRAVYLAYYMGAREIRIYGFNPGRVVKRDDEVKRAKLQIAKTLLERINRRVSLVFYE